MTPSFSTTAKNAVGRHDAHARHAAYLAVIVALLADLRDLEPHLAHAQHGPHRQRPQSYPLSEDIFRKVACGERQSFFSSGPLSCLRADSPAGASRPHARRPRCRDAATAIFPRPDAFCTFFSLIQTETTCAIAVFFLLFLSADAVHAAQAVARAAVRDVMLLRLAADALPRWRRRALRRAFRAAGFRARSADTA